MITALVYILVLLLVAAVFAWLISTFVPEGKYRQAALVVLGLIAFLIIVSLLWPMLSGLLHLRAPPPSLRGKS